MKLKLFAVFVFIILYYIVGYCCPYTAAVIYTCTAPLHPEIRCVDMVGTDFHHAYVHVCGIDLFLNPFREYEDTYRTYATVDDYVSVYRDWGSLYIPVLNKFMRVV